MADGEPASGTSPALSADAPAPRRRRSSEDVRASLLRGARTVFERRGFAGATTREIAESANINEVLLFRHFMNKTNLFQETIALPFEEILQRFRPNGETGVGGDASLGWIETMVRQLSGETGLLMALIAADTFEENLDWKPDLTSFFQRSLAHVAEVLPAGEMPADMATTIRFGFAAVVGAVLLERWLFDQPLGEDPDRLVSLARFVERALQLPSPPLTSSQDKPGE